MVRDDDAYFGADQTIGDALAQLDTTRRRIEKNTEEQKNARTTIQAKDRSFSLVFDGPGNVVDMTFHGTKYRNAAPAELAHSIIETLQRGRLQSLEKMSESMGDSPLAGIDMVGIATGKVDASSAIDKVLAPFLDNIRGGARNTGGSRG